MATSTGCPAHAGKYLTFGLGDEEFGLEILRVREIIGVMDVTAVPRTAEHVKGVINLRGKVIPVIDLRLRLGLDEAAHTEETCTIVVNVGDIELGVIVDRVREVVDYIDADIEPAPAFGENIATDYIVGLGKTADRITILLGIEDVLMGEDLTWVDPHACQGNHRDGDASWERREPCSAT